MKARNLRSLFEEETVLNINQSAYRIFAVLARYASKRKGAPDEQPVGWILTSYRPKGVENDIVWFKFEDIRDMSLNDGTQYAAQNGLPTKSPHRRSLDAGEIAELSMDIGIDLLELHSYAEVKNLLRPYAAKVGVMKYLVRRAIPILRFGEETL